MKERKRRSRGLTIILLLLSLLLVAAIAWGVLSGIKTLFHYSDTAQIGKTDETLEDDPTIEQEEEDSLIPDALEGLPRNRYEPGKFFEQDGIRYYESDTCEGVPGIDVSSHQGEIDWQQVKEAGIEFAIIRLGYRGYVTGELALDEFFVRNIEGAQAAGIDVGVYFFSQALTEEEAVEEADFVLKELEPYHITYPVIFDWEEVSSTSARTNEMNMLLLTACAKAFCERVEEAGLRGGIYFNQAYGYQQFNLLSLKDHIFWLAQYEETPTFVYDFQMWQYTNEGTVSGISTNVDLNICFWSKS